VTTRIQGRIGVGRTIVLGAAATGPVGLLVPFASPDTAVLLIGASFFLMSICNVVYNVSQVSLRQAITPDRLLGRMNASMRFLVWGTIPIGSLIGAGLSEVIGVQQTIWVSAILGLFAFLPVLISKVRGIQTIPTGEPEPTAA
jgi:predicted MFS family arabinose efflux permease